LAIGGYPASDSIEIRVFEFDPAASTLTQIATANHGNNILRSVDWDPTGKYLAIGGYRASDNIEIRVFAFDPAASTLTQVATANHDNSNVFSVDWDPTGRYLAIGGNPASDNKEIRVFEFDPAAKIPLTQIATANHGNRIVLSVDWDPTGRYLAIGGGSTSGIEIRVFEFDPAATIPLTQVATANNDNRAVLSVDWDPKGRYLAIGGAPASDNIEIRVFEFDPAASTPLTQVATANHGNSTVLSVDWGSTGQYLAIGGESVSDNIEIRVFAFDPAASTPLTQVTTATHGNSAVWSVDWDPTDRYLAIGGNVVGLPPNDIEIRIYETVEGATKCLILDNEVCNCSGVGLDGNSNGNLIAKNVCFNNNWLNFGGIINKYTGGLLGYPSTIANIGIPPYETTQEDTEVDSLVDAVENQVDTVNAKLDTILDVICTIDSKIDYIGDNCASVSIKIDVMDKDIVTIDSKMDVLIDDCDTVKSKLDVVDDLIDTISSKLDPIAECCDTVVSKLDYLDDVVSTIDSKVDLLEPCCENVTSILDSSETKIDILLQGQRICEVIRTATTITLPGCYILGNRIDGSITIASDAVSLDFSGFDVYQSNPGIDTVVIGSNKKEIVIKNGSVRGGNAGIAINDGASLVTIEDMRVMDSIEGIKLDGLATGTGIRCCKIVDAVVTDCDKGIVLDGTIKSLFERCQVCNCVEAGFALSESKYNCFRYCSVLEIENSDATKSALGFASTGGQGNMFINCISSGHTKSGTNNFGSNATGFLLYGTEDTAAETKTKILDCIASSITGAIDGNAYGIHLDFALNTSPFATSFTTDHGDTLYATDWCPQSEFIAIGGMQGTDGSYLGVYRFDGTSLALTASSVVNNQIIRSVAFSPDGESLAVATDASSGDDELFVYSFDQMALNVNERLNLVDSIETGFKTNSVAWSPNGRFIAFGTDSISTDSEVKVYRFDGIDFSTDPIGSAQIGDDVTAVAFSPDGKFLAVVYSTSIQIFSFDPTKEGNALTSKATDSATATINFKSFAWSPIACSKYFIVAAGHGAPGPIELFEYDGATTITSLDQADHPNVNGVIWSPNGKYVLVCGSPDGGGDEIKIFGFDGSSLGSAIAAGSLPGGIANSCDWSPSGKYVVAVGQSSGGDDTVVFEVADVPTKCLIKNNEACNITGGLCGIGIEGSSGKNMIVKNIGYANNINFSPGVFNVYVDGLNGTPDNSLDNVAVPPYSA